MKRIVRLTEGDLMKLVKRVIRENESAKIDNLKNNKDIIFMKEKNNNSNQDTTYVVKINNVKSVIKFKWFFQGNIIATIVNGRVGDIGIIPMEFFVDLTDIFPEGIKREYDFSLATIYSRDFGTSYTEYELDDEDMEKVIQKCEENGGGGVFDKLEKGEYDDLSPDFSDLKFGLDKDEIMESRRYKKRYRK